MIGQILPFAATAILGGLVHSFLRKAWRKTAELKNKRQRRTVSPEIAKQWVAEFGQSSNSFMTLYPGFDYFVHPDPSVRGMIAFIEQTDAWVGGAQPICATSDSKTFLAAFAEAASSLGKTALLLPVDEANAQTAHEAGYRSIMIGTEPTFELDRYPRSGKTWNDVVPTAKVLANKGATVCEFHPTQISIQARSELEAIQTQWMESRRMGALGFLNQVDPWFLQADKRFFRVEMNGRTLAFLAAIPIGSTDGWYLNDLIRRNNTPPGSTELLQLQAMRILRESGAKKTTMGVAPLAGLENAHHHACAEHSSRRHAYKLLRLAYERGNVWYNFKPLHHYKLKFDPSSQPPAFLIYHGKLGPRTLLSLMRAFLPQGIARAGVSGTARLLAHFSLSGWLRSKVRSDIVVRSTPTTWTRLLSRCKLTPTVMLAYLLAYIITVDGNGKILPEIEVNWGFSWQAFLQHPPHSLLLSPFLHWNALHVSMNLLGCFTLMGSLELLAGTPIAASAFAIPMLLSNPLTSAILAGVISPFFPGINLSEIDIGGSLGIFGCAGALSVFLTRGNWLLLVLALAAGADAATRQTLMPLNHLVALALGFLVGRFQLKS